LSEGWSVIIPDTTVPGGWLCNHSCNPNADLYSDGDIRIQCRRPISPGEEVSIFYGWITDNEPERDPCRCGSIRCRRFINVDVGDGAALDPEKRNAFRARLLEYAEFLRSIGQEQVLKMIEAKLS